MKIARFICNIERSTTIYGDLAQLVEQGPEEPCVPSSSLGVATNFRNRNKKSGFMPRLFILLELAPAILVRVCQRASEGDTMALGVLPHILDRYERNFS